MNPNQNMEPNGSRIHPSFFILLSHKRSRRCRADKTTFLAKIYTEGPRCKPKQMTDAKAKVYLESFNGIEMQGVVCL